MNAFFTAALAATLVVGAASAASACNINYRISNKDADRDLFLQVVKFKGKGVDWGNDEIGQYTVFADTNRTERVMTILANSARIKVRIGYKWRGSAKMHWKTTGWQRCDRRFDFKVGQS